MIKTTLYTLFLSLICLSCTVTPAEIVYGTDTCHSCKMTIVDQQHAAQIVTQKGRTYKFDAIECMVESLDEYNEQELAFVLVTDYMQPKKLVDAASCFYLISESIPSPMGANLSAFAKKSDVMPLVVQNQDFLTDWKGLKGQLKSNPVASDL